jgi:dihydrofolate reductase
MSLSIIVAMTDHRVIGRDNTLPWRIPEDLKRFKAITMGHPIIMGRRTFESIGKALPGRRNIVVTSRPLQAEGIQTASSLDEALTLCPSSEGERFVIGGARLFEEALPRAKKLYLTLVHADISGDVYFPEVDLKSEFRIVQKNELKSTGPQGLDVEFLTAERPS